MSSTLSSSATPRTCTTTASLQLPSPNTISVRGVSLPSSVRRSESAPSGSAGVTVTNSPASGAVCSDTLYVSEVISLIASVRGVIRTPGRKSSLAIATVSAGAGRLE